MTAKKKAGPDASDLRRRTKKSESENISKSSEGMDSLSPEAARRMLKEMQQQQTHWKY